MTESGAVSLADQMLAATERGRKADADAVKIAEGRIQRVLWELEEATGKSVDHVEVDTRNFAQLRTEITLKVAVA